MGRLIRSWVGLGLLIGLTPLLGWAQPPGRGARKAVGGYDFTQHGLQALHLRYPALTGQGITVSVKEQPFDTADVDIRGRIVASTIPGPLFSDHATTMATLLAGAGNSEAAGRGVANGVRLASASFTRLLPDTLPELRRLGISVQNHAYGVRIERFYGPEARAYDEQVQQEPTLLHVFSSGNSGAATDEAAPMAPFGTLTGEFKQAKNALVVGGISSQNQLEPASSRGPTADGRIKPELVAYGNNGTSESAALVSGTAALLQQAYRNRHGQLPSAAWVKACLIATAHDLHVPGPDHEKGFGSLNALAAVETAQQGHYQTGTMMPGNRQAILITVPPNTARLTVALAWTDPPARPGAARQLVNDLDLWLESESTEIITRPWVLPSADDRSELRLPAQPGIDRLNNVEQLSVDVPSPGTYRIWVQGTYLTETQPYAVAYTFGPEMTWLSPTPGALLRAGEPQPIRWQWLGSSNIVGSLDVQLAGDTTWQTVVPLLRMEDQVAWWSTPDLNRRGRVRLSTTGGVFVSDTFTLSRPTPLQVLLNCDAGRGLRRGAVAWQPQPGATGYQLYTLGTTYLEPLRQTTDTVAFLTPANGPYIAVAPLLNGKPGLTSFLIDYRRQGVGCYITNWLSRLPVADTARLDLTLSTTWNLTSLTLERATLADFVAVQTVRVTPGQVAYTFRDHPATLGPVRYRLRLTTATGDTILTDEQTVYVVGPEQQLVFPNPAAVGTSVSVLLANEEVVGTWFSADGRQGKSVVLTGSIKQMPTDDLKPGVHILRLTTSAGIVRTATVLIH